VDAGDCRNRSSTLAVVIRRFALASFAAAASAATVTLAMSAPAFAHIDPDPVEAQAGSTLSVAFTIEHGCDGSPTVQLDMRLPEGVTDAEPEPFEDFEGSIDDDVITYVGGPLADDQEATFSVRMTLPPTPDTTIFFPIVQRCEQGEIRWIGIPDEPGDELDEPAPALALTGPVASTTAPVSTEPAVVPAPPTVPAETEAPSSTDPGTDAETNPETDDTLVATAITEPESSIPAAGEDDGSDSDTGTIFFIATVVVVLGLGVFVYFRARSARAGQSPSDAG
jgi:uncharacterized protein YcnI